MAAPASELGWVVHFAPVVRFRYPTFPYASDLLKSSRIITIYAILGTPIALLHHLPLERSSEVTLCRHQVTVHFCQ